MNINRPTKYIEPNYPKQTEDLCISGGAEWKLFSTGCHDECWIQRSKEPIKCTEAFSYGCDCGKDKCWDGNSCISE